MIIKLFVRRLLLGLNLFSIFIAIPFMAHAESVSLPEPLTLQAALATASNQEHPEIRLIEQKINEVLALSGVKSSESDFSIDIKGRLRKVGPSDIGDPDEDNDSAASLLLSKPIYDFGASNARLDTLALQHQVLLLEKQQLITQRRLLIMEKYFDVLNADNDFISENENLAIGFIRYDRARENLEFGSTSEIDVVRLQADYERIRQRLNQAQHQQRLTRMILAEAMGYPQQLPATLESPEVDLNRPLSKDIEAIIKMALTSSMEAKILIGKSRIAESTIQQADKINAPRLDFELEVSTYERETSTRDDWRATIYFDVPIYSTERSSGLELARAQYQQTLSEISQYESLIRLRVLEYWQSIEQNRLIAQGAEVE